MWQPAAVFNAALCAECMLKLFTSPGMCTHTTLQCYETNTRCQMVTPLLYCTCMMVWSAVTPLINSREHCIGLYYIGNVSLTM